jgi:hypothetical protein
MRFPFVFLTVAACSGRVIGSPDAAAVGVPDALTPPVPDAATTPPGTLPACSYAPGLPAVSTDWIAYRAALVCGNASGASFCPSNDGVACPAGSRLPPFSPCVDQCAPNEYALVPNPAPRPLMGDAASSFAPAPAGCVPTTPPLGISVATQGGQPSLECCPCM